LKATRIAVVGALVAGSSLFAGAATARADAAVGCGSTITTSTTLNADVGPCPPGDGLDITGSGIRLNLNGHQVIGSGVGGQYAGIRLVNATGDTVTGPGSVSGFDAGVVDYRGMRNTIENLEAHDNADAQFVADHPLKGQFGDGIIIYGASYDRVLHNSVHDNGPFSGITVLAETELRPGLPTTGSITGPAPMWNVIDGNNVSHNNVDDVCPTSSTDCPPGAGVYSEDIGIRIEGPEASHTTVSHNIASWNGRTGISPLNTFGKFSPPTANIPPNTDTVIVGNDIEHDGIATTIYDNDPSIGPVEGDGIFNRCYNGSPQKGCPVRTVISGNYVAHNTASGIDLQVSKGATVVGNVSLFNNIDYTNTFVSQVNTAGPYDDGTDNNTDPACDSNVWLNNVLKTYSQPCVLFHPAGAAPTGVSAPTAPRAASVAPTSAEATGNEPTALSRGARQAV
jgi:hypothetical protein